MGKPLDGIRVFDLTLAGVGPWSAKQLGELGADVIHVEAPGRAQMAVPPLFDGLSVLYITANYNKRSIMLDLKDTRAREAAYRLLRSCDVFVENMRPGVVSRLGLDYETVSGINPGIVYCSASGYGQTGHMVPKPGADPQIQAYSGWSSITGREGGDPEQFRHFAHLDFNTSQYIVQGVLMALLARARTGKGQKVEVAMLAASLALQSTRVGEFLATGEDPPRMGSATVTTVPHQAFLCQDQQYLSVGVVKEEQWSALCRALGMDELAGDARFSTNRQRVEQRAELVPLLEERFRTKPVRWWEIRLTAEGVPNGRVLSFDQLRYHPQVLENNLIELMDTEHWGPIYREGAPWQFSKADTIEVLPPPLPDEHTEQVLAELFPEEPVAEPAAASTEG